MPMAELADAIVESGRQTLIAAARTVSPSIVSSLYFQERWADKTARRAKNVRRTGYVSCIASPELSLHF